MDVIELEAVGPIRHLAIPVPEGGGVVVLKGANGVGKTHGVNAVASLYDPVVRKGLRAMDGAPAGSVKGLGVTVKLQRVNRAAGELSAATLDGACDPSVLVDPGIKDPEAADARRLATLVRLSGVVVGPEQWRSWLGAAAQHLDVDALCGADAVESASAIRRRLQQLALAQEREAEKSAEEANVYDAQAAVVDLAAPCDEEQLLAAADCASEALIVAQQRRKAAEESQAAADRAQAQIDEYSAKAIDVEKCEKDLELANAAVLAADEFVANTKKVLADAEAQLMRAKCGRDALGEQLDKATRQRAFLAQLRDKVSANTDGPTDGEIQTLQAEKQRAQTAVEYGARVRLAQKAKAQATFSRQLAETLLGSAREFRALAGGTDRLLEQALVEAGFTAVKVSGGRLCVESHRGLEPFSDLSHGERWRVALELAAAGVGKSGLIPVCQEAWESLDPENRKAVAELSQQHGLCIVTAEATAGELRAEPFPGE